ncbi:MAG: PRC-barrel domain-containing protein, partial [Fibrobacterota bacterium]|nr:PRC-barrel domain-containing protein [Chitinispirillaceae bacterium]
MFNHLKMLQGYRLQAMDGPIGKVDEFYFDEQFWTIRYLVVNTGNWLSDRQLLISPYAIGEISPLEHQISIKLTKRQIADSPFLAAGQMVSKKFEREYYDYFGWPVYWNGTYMWGVDPYLNKTPPVWSQQLNHEEWDPRLCSSHDISRYTIHSMEGEIGSIRDFL